MVYLEMFEDYKKNIEGNSNNSIKQYVSELNKFFDFLNVKLNDEIVQVSSIDVQSYIAKLVEMGNSANTRNHKLTIIKTFYTYLQRELDLKIDYRILTLKYSKTAKVEKKWLNSDEVNDLLLASANDYRANAYICLMYTTGARLSDISQIKLSDVMKIKGYDEEGNAIYKVRVNGKGNKERDLFLNNKKYDTMGRIMKYIDMKRNKIVEKYDVDSDLLFISNKGEPLDHSNIRKSIKRYAKKANIDEYWEVSPHTLRHSFATNLLNKGVSVAVVRNAMGHASISTTNTYAHADINSIKDAMQDV